MTKENRYVPDLVKNAMLVGWREICADTGCHPLDIEHGKGRVLTFEPRHWAQMAGKIVAVQVARLYSVEWPEPKVTNPDIAAPTGVPYIDCLLHRLLDAQQDINFVANCEMSQSLCDASALISEVETAIRKLASVRHEKKTAEAA